MAQRLRDAGWRISSVPTPQRGGHPSERGHRCPSCQIRIPARRRPAHLDGRSVRSTPRSSGKLCELGAVSPWSRPRPRRKSVSLNRSRDECTVNRPVTGRRADPEPTNQALVHQGRDFARPSQLRAPDVEVGRALNRSAVAVLIITSISRVRAAGARSPDRTVDTSRCTTREFSRTVISVESRGHPAIRWPRRLGCWIRWPYDDCISSASWCAGPRRCRSTWRQVCGVSLGPS
jgi:hypothetical protein